MVTAPQSSPVARYEALSFSDIAGWNDDDHTRAFDCFLVSARRMQQRPYTTKLLGTDAASLARAGKIALDIGPGVDRQKAKNFFETCFNPSRIQPPISKADEEIYAGFVTGYYEPEAQASLVRTERFRFPILKPPDDLVTITDATRPAHMDKAFFFARNQNGMLRTCEDRTAIENGALDGLGLELFWLESRIDVFFIHIQGSARLQMSDGSVRRISYSAKSGHPFTGIGRILIDQGEIANEKISMQSIRSWLQGHPDRADLLMRQNRSYIFFQEIDHPDLQMGPVAAAGVPLTAGRSIAVDHRLHTFATPLWICAPKPLAGTIEPFARLMIAQDTGSAIVGPARGDLFTGSGIAAGELAGTIASAADFIALIPVV
jgi:membrane-bound lytic murein transglycosylase A